jgi:hypothetical protein
VRCASFYTTTGSFVTSEGAGLPSRTESMLSRASMPIAKRVSTVALPICGNRNVFLSATYPGCSFGSPSKTSSPPPATQPLLRAAMRSSSTTMPPRAVLIRIAPRGSRSMVFELMK